MYYFIVQSYNNVLSAYNYITFYLLTSTYVHTMLLKTCLGH